MTAAEIVAGLVPHDDPRLGTAPWYDCDGRPMTPTAIGYEGAAFYRYRARLGASTSDTVVKHWRHRADRIH